MYEEMKSAYSCTASGKSWNASDKLREILRPNIGHFAERQQLVNDDKTTVKKLGFDAVAMIVQEPRVLYLHTSQVWLHNQSITWIAINLLQYHVHATWKFPQYFIFTYLNVQLFYSTGNTPLQTSLHNEQ